MRARIKKRQRNRNIIIVLVVVAAIIVVIGVSYSLYSLTVKRSDLDGKPVSAAIYASMTQVASSSSYGPDNSCLISACGNVASPVKSATGAAYTSGGKPIVLYIGGEFCPLCAFQRWPLAIALMRFGNLTGLEYMQSASDDADPNTYTFSFLTAHYTSQYVVFQSYEQEDVNHAPLQTVPLNYTTEFNSYGAYPYLNFGNRYIVEGSFFEPTAFAGLNWTQIIQQINNPNTQISAQVMSSANAITALICSLTGGSPNSVCSNQSITGLQISPASFHPTSNVAPLVSTTYVMRGRNYAENGVSDEVTHASRA